MLTKMAESDSPTFTLDMDRVGRIKAHYT
jgi:hypothetical protein